MVSSVIEDSAQAINELAASVMNSVLPPER